MTNAKKKVGAIKSIFETNELLRALFPDLLPRGDRPWSSECLTLNRTLSEPEGTFEPAGTGTAITSRHYDEVIEDDTVAPDYDAMTGTIQQPTQTEIEKAIGFHKMCHPLLLHPTKSCITVIGTRWAPTDLIGWILEHNFGYDIVTRAALENPNGDPAAWAQGGRPIWDRFDIDVLQEIQRTLGLFMFDMLYMNTPSAAVNQVFKREHIQYYNNLPSDLLYCTSVDPAPADAQAKTTDPDYNVILTTALKPSTGEIYVVHYNRERIEPGEVVSRIFNHYRAYKPLVVKVESTAYQSTLCYWIRRQQQQNNELFYVEQMKNAKASKAARIMGLEPWFAAHRVHIRTEHTDLERELLSFDPAKRSGGHDDVIDALSMQVDFWSKSCETYEAEKREDEIVDPFAGQQVIDELLGRATKANRYPYDMGLMAERLVDELPRQDYVGVY
jgi:predicted phage terminase large subunit-like protein